MAQKLTFYASRLASPAVLTRLLLWLRLVIHNSNHLAIGAAQRRNEFEALGKLLIQSRYVKGSVYSTKGYSYGFLHTANVKSCQTLPQSIREVSLAGLDARGPAPE